MAVTARVPPLSQVSQGCLAAGAWLLAEARPGCTEWCWALSRHHGAHLQIVAHLEAVQDPDAQQGLRRRAGDTVAPLPELERVEQEPAGSKQYCIFRLGRHFDCAHTSCLGQVVQGPAQASSGSEVWQRVRIGWLSCLQGLPPRWEAAKARDSGEDRHDSIEAPESTAQINQAYAHQEDMLAPFLGGTEHLKCRGTALVHQAGRQTHFSCCFDKLEASVNTLCSSHHSAVRHAE